jgi:2,4-didehydro-3-deoxy-L-rhamnonate hydrolase
MERQAMKLIRFGEPGKERPGLTMDDAVRLDVSGCVQDYDEVFFANDGISRLRQWLEEHATSAPRVASSVRLGSPISRPSKIVCIGLSFRDHLRKAKWRFPRSQSYFSKPRRHWPGRDIWDVAED